MPTIVTKSIGTASRDYSTIALWEAAIGGAGNDITAAGTDEVWIGECYNDSEFTSAGTVVTFSGTTTDSTHYIHLTCHAGQSFRDNANVQTNALRYNVSNGVGIRGNTGGYSHVMIVSEDNVRLSKLQIKNDQTGSPGACAFRHTAAGYTGSLIDGCILDGTRHGGTAGFAAVEFFSGVLRNSLVMNHDTARVLTVGYAGSTPPTIVNCTFIRPSDGSGTTEAIESSSGTTSVTNCAIFGFTSVTNNDARFTGNNNCSDLAIGFGSSNQSSKTYANQFQNTVYSTGDFRLKSGADCIDNGATDTTNGTPDIAGTTRPSGSAYDIGCWEFISAATFVPYQPAYFYAPAGGY